MAQRDSREPLRDILRSCELVAGWVQGRTFEAFVADRMFQAAVEREIEIVSEASRRVAEELKLRRPDLPWRDIATVGNVLRHKYGEIIDPEIWQIATLDLPALAVAAEQLLRGLDEPT
ncbi:MAG: DUF86 domain-containing protein [Reyranellaceae bacterium]